MSSAKARFLSAALERKLRQQQLADLIANRRYEGEINGPEDTVRILKNENSTVQDYTGGKVTVSSAPTLPLADLEMDSSKFFSFSVDGNSGLMNYLEDLADESFREILEVADKRILQEAGNASNSFGTFTSGTDDVKTLFGDARSTLTNAGVPQQQRFAVVPPAVGNEVYENITERQSERGDDQLQQATVGNYYGFTVIERPTDFFFTGGGTDPIALFGQRTRGITYADAVVSVEIVSPVEGRPGGVVIQGLHTYGAKTVEADALFSATIA